MPKIQQRVGYKIINIMSFFEAVKTCLVEKFCIFSSRANRSEFWWFQLFTTLVMFTSLTIGIFFMEILDIEEGMPIIFGITCILLLIPNLTARIRRLHDVGISGWWLLISLIPYIGGIILFILYLLPSVSETTDENDQQVVQ